MRLAELRKARGLSQRQLAEDLQISQNSISQYELGKREPNQNTLLALANYFAVSVDYLLGNTAHTSDVWHLQETLQQRPELQQLLELSLKASEEDVENTLRILEALSRDQR